MRRVVYIAMLVGVFALTWWLIPARGQLPTGCTFPTATDDFQAVAIGQRWTAELHNKLQCAVNELEYYALSRANYNVQCTSTSFQPRERKAVPIQIAETMASTSTINVSVKDANAPTGYVHPGGVQGVSGDIVTVYAWNRDALNARTATVCVQVVDS